MNNINFSKNGKAPVSIYISSEIWMDLITNLYSVAVNESMIEIMLLHIDKYDIQNFTKGLKKNYDPSAEIPFIGEVSEMPENISLNALKDLVQKIPTLKDLEVFIQLIPENATLKDLKDLVKMPENSTLKALIALIV